MKNPPLSGFLLLLLVCGLNTGNSYAKIFPAEDAKLNYRIIGFSFPEMRECSSYKIEIDPGNITDAAQFKPQIQSASSKTNRIIAEVPDFGAIYTWRIIYTTNNNKSVESQLYHFSTLAIPYKNDIKYQLKVTRNSFPKEDFYILVDGDNMMYDNNGMPVWFLPDSNSSFLTGQDMKVTAQHTITLISQSGAYEINYAGKVLWSDPFPKFVPGQPFSPNGDRVVFHHEFSRLQNGHYMALVNVMHANNGAQANGNKPLNSSNDNRYHFFQGNLFCNMLDEFDASGNLLWSWKSADYFEKSDVKYLLHDVDSQWQKPLNSHENSFYFDEKNKVIYFSYAGFNRIVKISYPFGEILNTYGTLYDTVSGRNTLFANSGKANINDTIEQKIFNNNLFDGQHSCKITKEGNLLILDNNMDYAGVPPKVLLLSESKPNQLNKIWEFSCPTDDADSNQPNGGGGCASELEDGSLFVCMNAPYNTLFIVNKNKEILWRANPEMMNAKSKICTKALPYRSSVITPSALHQLIWQSETDEGAYNKKETVAVRGLSNKKAIIAPIPSGRKIIIDGGH